MVVSINADYSELMSAYFCSEECVAVLDDNNRLIGIYGKKENDNLIKKIVKENFIDISINEIINREYSKIIYTKNIQKNIFDFFREHDYRYVPIVYPNGKFIEFEYNPYLKHTISDEEKIKRIIAKRWRNYDKSECNYENYKLKCLICDGGINISEAEKRISSCIFGGGKLERYVCPNCGAIIGPIKMLKLSSDSLAEDYRQHYSVFQEGDTTQDEIKTFYSMHPQKKKCYLNYGCGGDWSQSIKKLRQEGYEVYGYEPFSQNSSLDYIITDSKVLKTLRFDGIFSNNLIEHLVNPVEELRFMKSLLKEDDSIMAHSTGCYEYRYAYTRFHLCFPVGKSAEIMYKNAGLVPIKRDELYLHNDRYICMLLRKM